MSRPRPNPDHVQLATNEARSSARKAVLEPHNSDGALANAIVNLANAIDRLAADLAAGKR